VVGFFLRGSVPERSRSTRRSGRSRAGSYAWGRRAWVAEPQAYASIAEILTEAVRDPARVSEEERVERMRQAFLDSVVTTRLGRAGRRVPLVRTRLDLDHRLARDAGAADLKTVTLAFTEYRARSATRHRSRRGRRYYGTDHTTRLISKDEFQREFQGHRGDGPTYGWTRSTRTS